jgi:CheY-like chemotaxis protein
VLTLSDRAPAAEACGFALRPRPSRPGTRTVRVLVADPHADTVESMAWLLRLWGHDVRCARSGPETLEAALAYRPDVILMELGLPAVGGCEVARRLRRGGALPQTLLVAVTGYGEERYRLLALDAGFDLHLVKPACPDVLRRLLTTTHDRQEGLT